MESENITMADRRLEAYSDFEVDSDPYGMSLYADDYDDEDDYDYEPLAAEEPELIATAPLVPDDPL